MTLPRNLRLPGAKTDAVFRSGRKVVDPLAVMYWQPALSDGSSRAAFVASRRLGGAVVRNRLRRRFKEGFRRYAPQIQPNSHLIFVIRNKAIGAPTAAIHQAVARLLRRSGLLAFPEEQLGPDNRGST